MIDWATVGTIAGTLITALGFFYGFLRNFKNDINSHIDRINEEHRRLDNRWMQTNARMDGVYHLLLKKSGEGKK